MTDSGPGRNIVIFCDGTWNSPEEESFGLPTATNVHKLYRACLDRASSDGRQVLWYQSGVGATGGRFQRAFEGATGTGVSRGIRRGYAAIAANYRGPQDRIFLIGFSRGAFTARSIAGMIERVGLVRSPTARLVKQAYARYCNGTGPLPDFERHLMVRVHAIGAWETVGALGLAVWGRSYNLRSVFRNDFHLLSPRRTVDHVFHALALDEKRTSFMPVFWREEAGPPNAKVVECWFRGVHSDVGGGYADCRLSDISLDWMARQLKSVGLLFRDHAPSVRPEPTGRVHNSYQGPLWTSVASWPRASATKTIDEGATERWHLHESIRQRELQMPAVGSDELHRRRLGSCESTRVEVAADRLWVYTGLVLEAGVAYRITAEGHWQDADDAPVGPTGQQIESESFIKRLARRRRRAASAPWMALVALANQPIEIPATAGSLWTGLRHWLWQDPVAFTRNLQPLLARRGVLVKPEQECVLWLFANDYFRKYDNNTGSVTATISRESFERSSDEQDWQGPLLLCSEMQAGDVLLLRGTGVKSELIASATGGVYSHAALILKDSEDFLAQIYESDGLGVGPSSYPTATVRIQGTTRLPLALVMGRGVQVARLLRHPEIEKVPSSKLSAAQTLIRSEHNFRSYSAIGRLVRPLGFPPFVELSINRVQELNDRLANRELRRGVFCSELVGVFFDHLGLPLLPGGHESSTLSPNHLDQGRSNLVDVPQAVINREGFDQVVGFEMHDLQFTPRERALPGMVEMSATAERTGAKSRQILNLVKDLSGGVHARSQQQAREQLGAINSAVDGYLSIGDVNRAQRMARSASSISWSVMAEQIAHEALFRDWGALGVQSKEFEPIVVAAIRHLQSLVQTVRIITRHDETRLNLRWLLGNLKKEDDIGAVARWKNRRQRRKL